MISYIVKHGIVTVTESQLDYLEAIVPGSARYTTAEAGDCIVDLGGDCFEDDGQLPDWLLNVLAEALSNNVQFLHFAT